MWSRDYVTVRPCPIYRPMQRRVCCCAGRRGRSTAAGAQLHSVRSKCGQCHVYSRRRRLNKDLFSASDLGLGRYDVVDNECVSSHECFDAHGPDIHSRTTIVSHRRLTLKCHKAELCRNDSTDRTRFLSQRLSSSYAALSISVRLCVPHDGRDAGVARSCGSRNLYMLVSGSSQWRNYNFWPPGKHSLRSRPIITVLIHNSGHFGPGSGH